MRSARSTALVATAVFFSGCSAHAGLPGGSETVPAHSAPATSQAYRIIHRFGRALKERGGANPSTELIELNGTFYGTTRGGGTYRYGTIYSITPAGAKHTLYSFGAAADDGSQPSASLTALNGTLYGVTAGGGTCYGGTIFSLRPSTTSGSYAVLHDFCNSDGENPQGALIAVSGTLYGTASQYLGSGPYSGAVFSLTTGGVYTVLHYFPQPITYGDGYDPTGNLAAIGDTLYGTTEAGGTTGAGTVYSITTAGKERLVYSFLGTSDGEGPMGGVYASGGTLYGTTYTGGEGSCFLGSGCGVVFGVTTKGVEKLLYRFDAAAGGQNPVAGVIDVDGTLYGTTAWGGGGTCEFDTTRFVGCGTVYALTASGTETVLHTFVGGTDGSNPESDLLSANGALYGTTTSGGFTKKCHIARGEADVGCGTVFTLTP